MNGSQIHFLLVLLFAIFTAACSKVWNAHELIIGEWDLELRGGWFFSPQRIFPRCTSGRGKQLSMHRRPWGSSLYCSLSMCPDGTFVLKPKVVGRHAEQGRLVMRGHWDVLANPYCITDRFYDQLQLKSLPRATLVSTEAGSRQGYGSVDLSCRVWGRHVRSKTLGRRAWMTHGTLLWKDGGLTSVKSSARTRRVLASFSAKRTQRESSIPGWEDQEVFGY